MTIVEIQKLVCRTYGLSRTELLGRRRRFSEPRQVAMWLAREMTPHSVAVIGRSFDRDYTTVIFALQQIDDQRRADQAFALHLGGLRHRLEHFQDIELAEAKEDLARQIAEAKAEMRVVA